MTINDDVNGKWITKVIVNIKKSFTLEKEAELEETGK